MTSDLTSEVIGGRYGKKCLFLRVLCLTDVRRDRCTYGFETLHMASSCVRAGFRLFELGLRGL